MPGAPVEGRPTDPKPKFKGPEMAAQYAFVMKGMTKTFPGAQKPVLSNISLQFYQGAKIGIVGPNGAGKSTLMKIMAGIDTDFTGEAWPGENITVGYLAQEPELDKSKTVLENVKDGARDRRGFRCADGRDGHAPGKDRRGRWLDARQPARDRDGSAALPAGRLVGRKSVRR
jgi:ATPase subunit of ABC transporter with duplicated ATPase domains